MSRLPVYLVASALALLLTAAGAWATNGMEATAWGARAAGMGGVDLAVALDATAINTNPAGLARLAGQRIDVGAALLIPGLHYKDELNDEDGATQVFPLPTLAYAYRFKQLPLALGVGVFGQGGMGADFKLEHPLLGKEIEYSSNVAYLKAAPAVAYQPHRMIAVGGALNFGYATMEMNMPYAVSPALLKGVADPGSGLTFGDMFGLPADQGGLGYDELTAQAELSDAAAFGWGGKLGLLFMPHERVTLGLAYTFKSTLNFEGQLTMDMQQQFNDAFERMVQGAIAQGVPPDQAQQAVMQQLEQMGIDPAAGMKADYDAEIEFAWPQKLGLGVAVTPTDRLLVGLDVTWIDWSDTMDEFKLKLRNGDNDNVNTLIGGDSIDAAMPLQWQDQIVVGVGLQYEFIDQLYGRAGYNYGNNPVPDDTVIPVFPAVIEHHAALGVGYGYKFFEVNAAYEHAFANTVEAADNHKVLAVYDNSESTLAEDTASLMLSFKF